MSYLTLGFSIVSFLAAGLIALSSAGAGDLQRDADPPSRMALQGACASKSNQSCNPGLRAATPLGAALR